jgi:hypothetical protein
MKAKVYSLCEVLFTWKKARARSCAGIAAILITISMGRQIQFHMLPEDARALLQFVHEHDPVIVTLRDSNLPEIKTVAGPSSETRTMTLWNQALLSTLARKHIVYPGREYYGIENSTPTLEFSPSRRCEWNERPALLLGRIYGSFETSVAGYEKWYNSLVRWVRKNFVKSPLPLTGRVGPAAYEWYRKGGVLLPMMLTPPITSVWLSWIEAQDQHRAVFSK